ncbi:epoxide hydrolase [Aspergillus nomiae NRRL 13137]|uniref:Epoxide hydrolase n=1 Tax=Aspergillus nomiae NRRL (strain ATCC 15546 / NRRL 13137 / CBS 260.88 / M93) TaxID=1509407 RepID=A0A0L1J8H4_ASPN3|nr:epoxide hydrolase [Aspergillus nomiae NRRL 13137]KNG88039.1 epoxide hydrolase [Aspergillus nomiae NRRL 13137]
MSSYVPRIPLSHLHPPPPENQSKPTILLLHGFPSTSYDWRHQIPYLSSLGYGIIAPDLLGYGATSKPCDITAYKTKSMAAEIISILDAEGVDKVHAVGHDTGCTLLSRLADYFPERLLSCVFLDVPYMSPAVKFDLDTVNNVTRNILGFERFGYVGFFAREGSGELLDRFADSFFTLFYPHNPSLWTSHLCPTGAIEEWLLSDHRAPLAPYITEEEFKTHQKLLVGHHASALNWYRALVSNINVEDEEQARITPSLSMPVLLVCPRKSSLEMPGLEEGMRAVCAGDLVVRRVSTTGHWVQLEAREEVNRMLGEFFEGMRT